MNNSKKNLSHKLTVVKINKGLNVLADKILFPEKLEKANQLLKVAGLPKKK